MATNGSEYQGGKGGGIAAPGMLDLSSRIQSGNILSEKQLMKMKLADEAGEDDIDAEAHDDKDPIEGVRSARSGLSGPPLNIAFQSFNDNGVSDGSQADNDNNFPRILHSPSSISWTTFKERGKPNESPFPDTNAERGNDGAVQELNAGKKSAVWDNPVLGVRDSQELKVNNDINETVLAPTTKPFKIKLQGKASNEAVRAVTAAMQRQSITGSNAVTNKKCGPSVRRESYDITEKRGYATDPEPTTSKKEKAGFGFSKVLLKKKTRTSSKRKNQNESRDKKAPAAAMVISEDEDERALLHTFNASSNSFLAKEKGILNLRQRVFNLGKSRQPKKLPTETTPTSKTDNIDSSKEKEDKMPAQLRLLQQVPSTPVKTSSNGSNDNQPSSSMSTPVVNNKEKPAAVLISTSTPVKKKSSLEKEKDSSPLLATVIVTPINGLAPRQDAKKTCSLTPPPKDTPTTAASATSSNWNLSPEATPVGRNSNSSRRSTKTPKAMSKTALSAASSNLNSSQEVTPAGRSRKSPQHANRPKMLPPAMPPSMVSCKTMSEDEAEKESIGCTHSCTSSQKEYPTFEPSEPGEKVSRSTDPPGAAFEGALSWGVLTSVLSEEGYENPSTYTIPNPMPNGWPAEDTEGNVDNAQGNAEGDDEKDSVFKVLGGDCPDMLSKEKANGDNAADIDADPSPVISANVLLEVSSTAHTEAYEDNIEVKCMGLEGIEEENDQLNENENDKEEERSGLHSNKSTMSNTEISVAKTSKTQESSETEGTEGTAETYETENTCDNHAESASTKVPLKTLLESASKPREPSKKTTPSEDQAPTKQKRARGRLGRSKIREAVMSVRNVAEHRSKSRDRQSKSRDGIRIRTRSKSRGPSIKSGRSGRSGKSGKGGKSNIGKRLGLKRRQSGGEETSKDGKDTEEKCHDDLTAVTGLSVVAKELIKQARDNSPATVDDLDFLIINPVASPAQYHSTDTGLSRNAKHELEREDDLEATLEEIEVSCGSNKNEKKHRAPGNSRLSLNYYSASEEDDDTASYDDDITYNREESSESTDDHASGSSINFFNRKKNRKYSNLGNVLDDETEYSEDQGCPGDEDGNCTSFASFQPFGIPQEEIIEDLKDAFQDTIGAHITQMIKSFDLTEGFIAEGPGDVDERREQSSDVRRMKSYSSARRVKSYSNARSRMNSESLSVMRMRSERMSRSNAAKSERGGEGVERNQRRSRRRHQSRGDRYQLQDRHSGSHKRYDEHRGYGTTSRRIEATKKRNAQRTSSYREMEL